MRVKAKIIQGGKWCECSVRFSEHNGNHRRFAFPVESVMVEALKSCKSWDWTGMTTELRVSSQMTVPISRYWLSGSAGMRRMLEATFKYSKKARHSKLATLLVKTIARELLASNLCSAFLAQGWPSLVWEEEHVHIRSQPETPSCTQWLFCEEDYRCLPSGNQQLKVLLNTWNDLWKSCVLLKVLKVGIYNETHHAEKTILLKAVQFFTWSRCLTKHFWLAIVCIPVTSASGSLSSRPAGDA